MTILSQTFPCELQYPYITAESHIASPIMIFINSISASEIKYRESSWDAEMRRRRLVSTDIKYL